MGLLAHRDGEWRQFSSQRSHFRCSALKPPQHDVPGLIELMGGNASFVAFMDRHFEGGHNLHTNEPSHHIPYLYSFAGAPSKSQEWVRKIGREEYDHTATGLSGVSESSLPTATTRRIAAHLGIGEGSALLNGSLRMRTAVR